jgi:hypothetical protein
MNKQENYTIYRISKDIQQDPALLLLAAGTIMSQCHSFFLTVTSFVITEPPGGAATQRIKLEAIISDDKGHISKTLDAEGVPYQCAEFVVARFEQYLTSQSAQLCHDVVRELGGDELIK